LLLQAVDAAIGRDAGPSGLAGEVCLVVAGSDGETILHVALDGRARASFVDRVPPRTSALLLLGAREADAILREGLLPEGGLVQGAGDRALLAKFISRYFELKTMLDVRAAVGRSEDSR
jgi:hypothetical protein